MVSDEDLKKLKECLDSSNEGRLDIGLFNFHTKTSNRFSLNGILDRLDAAEKLLPAWQQQNGEPETRLIWEQAEMTWRKAAGK